MDDNIIRELLKAVIWEYQKHTEAIDDLMESMLNALALPHTDEVKAALRGIIDTNCSANYAAIDMLAYAAKVRERDDGTL